jgi:hypothetical protein
MAIDATDWTVNRSTKVIAYTGDDHGGASPTYARVIQFHRWLQGLADDAVATGDDELDITNTDPTSRSTDNIITLINGYTISDTEMEHLYDGSIVQEGGDTIYDGIVNYGNASVQIHLLQDGAILSDDWWNYNGAGLNPDATQGISHRFMIKVRADGVDIDQRKLIGICRTLDDSNQNTYGEFKINGTSRGNNVLALTDASDPFNTNTATTISGWTGITNTEGLRLIDVDNDGTDEEYYSEWNTNKPTRTISDFFERMKWITRVGSTTTIHGMDGDEFRGVTHSFPYSGTGWDPVTNDIGVWGTAITMTSVARTWTIGEAVHEDTATPVWKGRVLAQDDTNNLVIVDVESGTVTDADTFTGQTSSETGTVSGTPTAVTGGGAFVCLAVDDDGATGNLYVQVIKGTAPPNSGTIYESTDQTNSLSVTSAPTERTISIPFCGQSTGSAIIGAYGFGIEYADLTNSDKIRDLSDTVNTPPNLVTNTVGGLAVSGAAQADYVIVAPWDGTTYDANGDPAFEKTQLSLDTALTADNITQVEITESIPGYTPADGTIRVTDNNGFERRLHYNNWENGTPNRFYNIDTTDGNEDFASVNANVGNDVYITYLDQVASSATHSFTGVHSTDEDFVVLVRNGDSAAPIKQFIAEWSFTSSPQTLNAIRGVDS